MIFTTKAEYGVRLLVELGRAVDSGAPVSLKAIAEAENLPLAYLERIVALLKKAELVESTRGAHGGYRLARPAADIRMDEAVLALEGAVAPMTCFVDDSEHGRVLCRAASSRPSRARRSPTSSPSPTARARSADPPSRSASRCRSPAEPHRLPPSTNPKPERTHHG